MSEERKILEMLSAGQINVDEAAGLLEALHDSDNVDNKNKAPSLDARAITPSGKLLKIDVHQSGEEEVSLNFKVPVETAAMMESFIPKDIKNVIASQGFDLSALLVSMNQNFPKGKIIDLNVSHDSEDTYVLIEVIS